MASINSSNSLLHNAALLLTSIFFFANSYADITVLGIGEVEQMPNTATFTISIETRAKTAKETAKLNTENTEKTIQAIRTLLPDYRSVATKGYNLFPEYQYIREKNIRKFLGFKATNTIFVKTQDTRIVGELLDKAIDSGASKVDNLTFSYSDPEDLYQKALKYAIENSIKRAYTLSQSSSLLIDKVINIKQVSQSHIIPPTPGFTNLQQSAASLTTPISTPYIKTTATIQVTFSTK